MDITGIKSKVEKLLALSQSSNESEATSALEKAHQLLRDYNLSIDSINLSGNTAIEMEELSYSTVSRLRVWKLILMNYISEYNYCATYYTKMRSWGKSISEYKIIGKEYNVQSTKTMLDYLIDTIERLSLRVTFSERDSYRSGMVARIIFRLETQKEKENTIQECKALVVQEKKNIEEYFKGKDIIRKKVEQNIKDECAYIKGYQDGGEVILNKQLA